MEKLLTRVVPNDFEWSSGRLSPGDILLMQPADRNSDLRHGDILSIQINGVDQTEVYGRESLMIGVMVPFKVKANGTYYARKQD